MNDALEKGREKGQLLEFTPRTTKAREKLVLRRRLLSLEYWNEVVASPT